MVAVVLALLVVSGLPAETANPAALSPQAVECSEWRACRELALAAAGREEYETFHDLAWRAVQTGPKNDPDLMFLLARAQALSGRSHDALIMLGRLADLGVAVDTSGDEFERTRALAQWPETEVRLTAASVGRRLAPTSVSAGSSPTSASSPTAASPALPSPASSPTLASPGSMSGLPAIALPAGPAGVRFSMRPFVVSGLGYDALSRRFVVGDRLGRKLVAVDEGATQPIDLVRSDSAGFLDIAAVEIDGKRGDLWVASGGSSGSPATSDRNDDKGLLHRLQLVSGRPLRSYGADQSMKPVDVAVTTNGSVLVLDALTPQLLVLRRGAVALEPVMRIDLPDAVSVTAAGDEDVAFVASRNGVSRVDLRTRRASRVAVGPTGSGRSGGSGGSGGAEWPGGIERIRWHANALFAVQVNPDGSRRILRMDLNTRGTTITKITRVELAAPATADTFMTISSDELVYVTTVGRGDGGAGQSSADFVAYRVPLP